MNRNVISIHAPHAGRDGVNIKIIDKLILFQSTRPMRGATVRGGDAAMDYIFQSTRPMRGATDGSIPCDRSQCISIHAPHAGRDQRLGHR